MGTKSGSISFISELHPSEDSALKEIQDLLERNGDYVFGQINVVYLIDRDISSSKEMVSS